MLSQCGPRKLLRWMGGDPTSLPALTPLPFSCRVTMVDWTLGHTQRESSQDVRPPHCSLSPRVPWTPTGVVPSAFPFKLQDPGMCISLGGVAILTWGRGAPGSPLFYWRSPAGPPRTRSSASLEVSSEDRHNPTSVHPESHVARVL